MRAEDFKYQKCPFSAFVNECEFNKFESKEGHSILMTHSKLICTNSNSSGHSLGGCQGNFYSEF